jgi:polyphosphate kinase
VTSARSNVRWDVASVGALRTLAAAPLPLGLRGGEAQRGFHRDLYFDTPDGALRARQATCRFRLRSDDRRELLVSLQDDRQGATAYRRVESEVTEAEPAEAFSGASEAARVLRGLVNPAALAVELELEVERYRRAATPGWPRRARFELVYDIVTVRTAGLARTFQEIELRELRSGRPNLAQVSSAISEVYRLRAVTPDKRVRGSLVRTALESEALARQVGSGRSVALIALDGPRMACLADGTLLRLPVADGQGEGACRHLMQRVLGTAVGDLHLLSAVDQPPGNGQPRTLEVWIATRVGRTARLTAERPAEWLPAAEVLARVGSPAIRDVPTLAALRVLADSELFPRLSATATAEPDDSQSASPAPPAADAPVSDTGERSAPGPLLDGELSLLEFNSRVLALAESEDVPLLERVRYLSIVNANLDEFFMVRVGAVKYGDSQGAPESDGDSVVDQLLAVIARRARALVARQYRCFDACRGALAEHGVRLRSADTLSEAERDYLRGYFRSTIFPYLTPRAITSTPGHPFPLIAGQALCMGVMLRDSKAGAPLHLADLTIPVALPRLIQLPGGNDFVPIEEAIRLELHVLYPGRRVEQAHLFRITRHAEVDIDERRAGNLVQAVEERARLRRHQPVVRIEVDRAMPASLRELLLRELQLEPGARLGGLGPNDIYEIDGFMDLGALRELAGLPMPALKFPPFEPRPGLAQSEPLWDTLRERDVLVHHPYEAFATTVQRFFDEAADDPDVAAIKVALYRAGERSPVVDALLRAAGAGKDVAVFVELKARFDEQRNVLWAKRLEAAGVHVVHGVLGAKNHAKIALVVRREGDAARRYVHVGTGNYNADTARVYTDLGLFSAREGLCADIHDLFNGLTGSSTPAAHAYRECLVAPLGLLTGLIERIDREAEHARAGRGGQIRMKLNGLSDREVVHALYRASRAGVDIDLVVRGICTLCPGVPGVSDRIRVVSRLGRFLEHARIYSFANGGEPEYFIGSADLRPRNLRRRVEVLAPVHDAALRARLGEMLDAELADPTAWELAPDGRYTRRTPARDAQAVAAPVTLAAPDASAPASPAP